MAETSDNDGNDQINDIDKNATEAGVDNSDNDGPVENEITTENENEEDVEEENEIKEKPSADIKVVGLA